MRRCYTVDSSTPKPSPISSGCIFNAPLTNGDLTDHVNNVTGVTGNGQLTWSDSFGAYQIKTTTGGQNV